MRLLPRSLRNLNISTTAAVVHSHGSDFEIEEIWLDTLREDEVLVEIKACGICGMDVEATGLMKTPCVLGHEGAGVVVDTGAHVDNVKRGDRVILGYGFCGHCRACTHRRPFHCETGWELTFGGTREDGSVTAFAADGTPLAAAFFQQSSFARHAVTPARCVVPIADDVPWQVAAALPCGFMTGVGTALNILGLDEDATLLVNGAGAVGLGVVTGARMAGCSCIVALDIVPARLEAAVSFGATEALNPGTLDIGAWRDRNVPRGFSHVADSTGSRQAFQASIDSLATGGELAYAALPAPMDEFSFRPFPLFVRCAKLTAVSFGSVRPAGMLPTMLEWWRSGEFPVATAVRTWRFEDINQAVAAGVGGEAVKPVLLMDSSHGAG